MLVCQQKNEKEPYPQTGTRIGIPQYCDQHPTERIFEEHEQEILSTEIERKTVRDGRWIRKEWTSKFLVVLVFGVSSDMTRLEFKRKYNGIGLGKKQSRKGGRTLSSHAKREREQEVGKDRD